MLRTSLLCFLMVAFCTCQNYNPLCQKWCQGQTNLQPQICGWYCGGYAGGYPGDYQASYTGGYHAGYAGNYYASGYSSCDNGQSGYPGYPTYPIAYPQTPTIEWPGIKYPNLGAQIIPNPGQSMILDPVTPIVPRNDYKESIKILVDTKAKKEWACPADPQPRAGDISGAPSTEPVLTACEFNEQCASTPQQRFKCCYDDGLRRKTCKPAVLA